MLRLQDRGTAQLADVSKQLESLLFLLPSELRCNIYEYYLTFTHNDFADSLRPMHMFLDADRSHTTPLPPLMIACKCAYMELAPLVHTTAVLRVQAPGAWHERRIGFAIHGTLRFDRLRRVVLIIDLDYAYWNAWLDFFGAILTRADRLEHLIIDWAPRPLSHSRKLWEVRRDEKKESAFLDLLYDIRQLQTLTFHGRTPDYWSKELQERGMGANVNCHMGRWWKEPGFER